MAEKRKPTKKAEAATPKHTTSCEAARPTRTKAAIAAAQGPANSYLYTEALADEICQRLAEGESLKSICRSKGMPSFATVIAWALDATHPFADRYARAREVGYRVLAEELLEISDNSKGDFAQSEDGRKAVDHEHIARARLRVDTRKWMLAKMLPKIYGDRVLNEHVGKDGGPVEVKAQVDEFLAKLDAIARRQKELADQLEPEANYLRDGSQRLR